MSVLSKFASTTERAMTSRVGRTAIIGGAIGMAVLGDKSANNDSARMIMNAVIGTPEDAPGADEIILGRKMELGDIFNPLAPHLPDLPGNLGPGWRNLKYALQPGDGVVNPAVSDMRAAISKREAFINESYDAGLAETMTNDVSSTFHPRSHNNLNASGDIVFGLHRRRFG